MSLRKSSISLSSLVLLLVLSACGFQPLYVAERDGSLYEKLQHVKVGVIKERSGQILRTYLLQDLQLEGSSAQYTLNVSLAENTRKLGFRLDKTPRHQELVMDAGISLINEETGKVVLTDTLQATSSFSLGSTADLASYSADVAANKAKDDVLKVLSQDIKLRIATYLAYSEDVKDES